MEKVVKIKTSRKINKTKSINQSRKSVCSGMNSKTIFREEKEKSTTLRKTFSEKHLGINEAFEGRKELQAFVCNRIEKQKANKEIIESCQLKRKFVSINPHKSYVAKISTRSQEIPDNWSPLYIGGTTQLPDLKTREVKDVNQTEPNKLAENKPVSSPKYIYPDNVRITNNSSEISSNSTQNAEIRADIVLPTNITDTDLNKKKVRINLPIIKCDLDIVDDSFHIKSSSPCESQLSDINISENSNKSVDSEKVTVKLVNQTECIPHLSASFNNLVPQIPSDQDLGMKNERYKQFRVMNTNGKYHDNLNIFKRKGVLKNPKLYVDDIKIYKDQTNPETAELCNIQDFLENLSLIEDNLGGHKKTEDKRFSTANINFSSYEGVSQTPKSLVAKNQLKNQINGKLNKFTGQLRLHDTRFKLHSHPLSIVARDSTANLSAYKKKKVRYPLIFPKDNIGNISEKEVQKESKLTEYLTILSSKKQSSNCNPLPKRISSPFLEAVEELAKEEKLNIYSITYFEKRMKTLIEEEKERQKEVMNLTSTISVIPRKIQPKNIYKRVKLFTNNLKPIESRMKIKNSNEHILLKSICYSPQNDKMTINWNGVLKTPNK